MVCDHRVKEDGEELEKATGAEDFDNMVRFCARAAGKELATRHAAFHSVYMGRDHTELTHEFSVSQQDMLVTVYRQQQKHCKWLGDSTWEAKAQSLFADVFYLEYRDSFTSLKENIGQDRVGLLPSIVELNGYQVQDCITELKMLQEATESEWCNPHSLDGDKALRKALVQHCKARTLVVSKSLTDLLAAVNALSNSEICKAVLLERMRSMRADYIQHAKELNEFMQPPHTQEPNPFSTGGFGSQDISLA